MQNVGVLISTLALLALTASSVAPQATPYVSISDPAYLDLDMLVAEGLVRDIFVSERPYSHAAFARFAAEGARRADTRSEPLTSRALEALDRLRERFRQDGSRANASPVRVASVSSELTAANSPSRALRSGADGSIDGDLNPLLQMNQGRELVDGYTIAAEGVLEAQWGRHLAAQVRPRLWVDATTGPADIGADATLLDAYARSVVGPIGLEVGRSHVVLGYGSDGGPMISDNARGLDLMRMSMDRPTRLPGPFGVLGLWQVSALAADMGNDRDRPGSLLTVIRLAGRPTSHVEFGFNYLNHQGGEGSPHASLRERLHDILFFWSDGGVLQISDKVVGADLGLRLTPLRTQIFVNVLTTDDRGRFQQPAGGLWEDAIWSAGAHVFGLGPQRRYDVRAEWRHAGARAHTHHQFTSGLTLDGRVIGDVLGPNAAGFQVGMDRIGTRSVLSLTAAWERYSGDDFAWGVIEGGERWDIDWFLVADNPDEIRKRLVLAWLRRPEAGNLQLQARVGYEHVTRFAYTDRNRTNVLAQIRLGYAW